MGGLAALWVVCGWFGWFVSGLDGLKMVSSFIANACKYGASVLG